jgi:hypothetical protein
MCANRKLAITTLIALATGLACGSSGNGATHSISGAIVGASEVSVALSGAQSATTTTDSSGNYSFAGLADGSYTVTASKAGYTCSPASRDVTVNGADVTGQDFTAAATTYSISGAVTGASDVLVTFTSPGVDPVTTATDPLGQYSFAGLADGRTYTVTPSKDGYAFTPPSGEVTLAGQSVTGQDFQASLITFAVSGAVTELAEDGVALVGVSGVTVTLAAAGAMPETFTTGVDGSYAFDVVPGDYTVSAVKAGYAMPADLSVHVADADVPGQDFITATLTYAISGTVADGSAAPLPGVGVTLSRGGQNLRSASTNGTGSYAFEGLVPGFTYTVTPSSIYYSFTPLDVSLGAADVTDANFTGTLIHYQIAGTVTEAGVPIASPDLAVAYTSGDGSVTPCDVTGGTYTCTVTPGTYRVAPILNGKACAPASLTVDVAANVSGQDFHVGQWVWQNPLPDGLNLRSVSGTSATDAWAVGDAGQILHLGANGDWVVANGDGSGATATTNRLYGVFAVGASDVWSVGAGGTILHGDGTDTGWQDVSANGGSANVTTNSLNAVWAAGASDVWAVGASGTILQGDGTDTGWQDVSANGGATNVTTQTLNGVWGSDETHVWAVGNRGTILYYDGASWTDVSSTSGVATTRTLYAVWGSGASDVWAVGANGTILHGDGTTTGWQDVSANGGTSNVATAHLYGLWGSGPNDIWILGANGIVVHATGLGNAWEVSDLGSDALYAAWGDGTAHLWVVGSSRTIYHKDGAGVWTDHSSERVVPTGVTMNSVWAASEDEAWAVGTLGAIAHYQNGAWSLVEVAPWTTDVQATFNSVWGTSATDVWVVGVGYVAGEPNAQGTSVLLHWNGTEWRDDTYTNNGAKWSTRTLRGVHGSAPSDVWACGESGTVLRWNGSSWRLETNLPGTGTASFGTVWVSAQDDVWLANANSGVAYHYRGDSGWEQLDLPAPATRIWGSRPDDVWFVLQNSSSMARWDGSTMDTTLQAPTKNARGIWGSAADDVWMAAGGFYHWNGSGTWDPVSSPSTSAEFGGSETSVWAVGSFGTILHWE